jgi:hypothetical protein
VPPVPPVPAEDRGQVNVLASELDHTPAALDEVWSFHARCCSAAMSTCKVSTPCSAQSGVEDPALTSGLGERRNAASARGIEHLLRRERDRRHGRASGGEVEVAAMSTASSSVIVAARTAGRHRARTPPIARRRVTDPSRSSAAPRAPGGTGAAVPRRRDALDRIACYGAYLRVVTGDACVPDAVRVRMSPAGSVGL